MICFYGSFLYLAASGFFFAIFIPRGLFGYPLVGHVMAGGLFAVCLDDHRPLQGPAISSPFRSRPA